MRRRGAALLGLVLSVPSAAIALRVPAHRLARQAITPAHATRTSLLTAAAKRRPAGREVAPAAISQQARERGRARREAAKATRAASTSVASSGRTSTAGRSSQEEPATSGPTRLSDLPDFRGPARLLKQAKKAMADVPPSPIKGNLKKKAAKDAARKIEAFSAGLSVPLKEQLQYFRSHMRRLSPFESALAELTLDSLVSKGGLPLAAVIAQYDELRRAVVRVGKEGVATAANSTSREEAEQALDASLQAVEAAFDEKQEALLHLISTAQTLRRLPKVEVGAPVAVLVGMPNVGKSSIVTATSSGTPEINDYPFTTRGLKIGHVGKFGTPGRYQLMDTPGVLYRADADRNSMEGLTLAAVELLPSAIVFVMDLSGTCGEQSAARLQLKVREQIRAAFPERPWLDVRSKADLPLAEGITPEDVPNGALHVSVHEARGVDELAAAMTRMVEQVAHLIDAPVPEDGFVTPGAR